MHGRYSVCITRFPGPNRAMKHLLFSAFTAITCVSALAAEPADDNKAVQGTWKPTVGQLGGEAMPPEALKGVTLKIMGSAYEVVVEGEGPDKGTFTLDAAASPKTLTIKSEEGPNKGKTILAIYEIIGDTMRACYDISGDKRPTEFKSPANSTVFLVTYQRQK